MLNVEQITSTLAKLPDQALQQYAAMHKTDPYVLSLAVAESNRRKEMRAAGQAQMAGAMQPPKVVDQDIASMAAPEQLPENIGIGALPAPNIQRMADGGIAGYDDGGMANNASGPAGQLAYNNEPVMRMADGGEARSPFAVLNPSDALAGLKRIFSEGIDPVAAEQRRQAALRNLKAPPEETVGTSEFAEAQAKQAERQAALKKALAEDAKDADEPTTKAAKASAASDAGITSLMGQLTPMTLDERAAAVKRLAKDANDESSEAYRPWMEQLKADREAIAARKNQNIGEALMKAGFGMMASKSPYAMAGIGEGAAQGLAAYQEATKADDAAMRALRQSEMTLMQAQRAERSGNHRDATALMNQHRQEQQAAVQLGLQAQQIKQTGAYQQGMLAVHQAQQGQEAKVRAEYGRLQAKVMESLKNNMEYMTEQNPTKRQAIFNREMRTAAMANPFLATYAQNIGFVSGPAGGKVRTLEGVDVED